MSQEGFIHCSVPAQLKWVVDRHFKGRSGLIVLQIDASKLPPDVLKQLLAAAGDKKPAGVKKPDGDKKPVKKPDGDKKPEQKKTFTLPLMKWMRQPGIRTCSIGWPRISPTTDMT